MYTFSSLNLVEGLSLASLDLFEGLNLASVDILNGNYFFLDIELMNLGIGLIEHVNRIVVVPIMKLPLQQTFFQILLNLINRFFLLKLESQ